MTNPTLERVARAIYAERPWFLQAIVPSRAGPLMTPVPWDDAPQQARDMALSLAATVLQSLKQLDEGTLAKVATALHRSGRKGVAEGVRFAVYSYIDHILE